MPQLTAPGIMAFLGFDLSRANGETYLATVRDSSLTPQERAKGAMRLHMFPSLTDDVLTLARDPELPELTSYWVGSAAYSLLMHRRLPVEPEDFADFAPGALRHAAEDYARQQSSLPPDWDLERVRQVSGDPEAELHPLLGAASVAAEPGAASEGRPLRLAAVISVSGRMLFWDRDSGDWFVGDEDKPFWFTCIGPGISDLAEAIEAIRKT